MQKSKNKRKLSPRAISIIVAIGVLVSILIVIGLIVRVAWRRLQELIYTVSAMDTVIIIALISGMVTVLGLITNSVISMRMKNAEFKYKRKAALLRKLEAPYTQFVNMLFDMVHKKDDAGKMDEELRTRLIRDMSREIILYGSDEVVTKWGEYRKKAPGFTLDQHLFFIEGLLHLIRADMGIEQGQLAPGDLLTLFVDDFEAFSGSHFVLSFGKRKISWRVGV